MANLKTCADAVAGAGKEGLAWSGRALSSRLKKSTRTTHRHCITQRVELRSFKLVLRQFRAHRQMSNLKGGAQASGLLVLSLELGNHRLLIGAGRCGGG